MEAHLKTIILCIVGESGSGKTMAAEYVEQAYGAPMILSRTTRPPRYDGEIGHTFVTETEFDSYAKEDMLAYTVFNGFRYCCLKQDVSCGVMLYVIDEFGLQYLKDHFSDTYRIISLRLHRDKTKRLEVAGEERVARDEGKFTLPDSYFDYVCFNPTDSKNYLMRFVDDVMESILDIYV